MKGVNFVKRLSMTRKRSSEIFERLEGNFFKLFLPPNITMIFVTQIFAPPIFMTSLRQCSIRHKFICKESALIAYVLYSTGSHLLSLIVQNLFPSISWNLEKFIMPVHEVGKVCI